ncbi:hypothetical protein LJY25_16860 [Hymenobacter sp. BT175]|uniref:DUF6799 domain-containing protein n=1 Tax=Hymenobacter translucens TaxID=2886507 RepID=UPI001D0F2560|nr:DUF6799 domain-containing protein [Hymenobacter translucens]MCC2548123.1 hypothetical protein [Hymenobacter translucens]
MNRFLLALLLSLTLGTAAAQSKTAPKPAGAVEANSTDQFLMKDGRVVLRRGSQLTALTQNVRLADGTKVNYKSGIVELSGGKIITLKDGDYVTMQGDVVYATPSSAAESRGDKSVPTGAQFEQYVDRQNPKNLTELEARLDNMNSKITLMTQKIQLLNQKISLLSTGNQKAPDTSQLDQQIQTLDAQILQMK